MVEAPKAAAPTADAADDGSRHRQRRQRQWEVADAVVVAARLRRMAAGVAALQWRTASRRRTATRAALLRQATRAVPTKEAALDRSLEQWAGRSAR